MAVLVLVCVLATATTGALLFVKPEWFWYKKMRREPGGPRWENGKLMNPDKPVYDRDVLRTDENGDPVTYGDIYGID